jgi:hypothetical protein
VALSDDETEVVNRLSLKLRRAQGDLLRLDAYYEGIWRLEQLGLAVPPELRRFVTIVNWPRTVADTIAARCTLQGFRMPGASDVDAELSRIWQANDLDEESKLGRLDKLVLGRSAICVGSNEDDEDTPLVTVESPEEITWELDPRTRKVLNALRRYRDIEGREFATLYRQGGTVWLKRSGRGRSGWVEDEDGTVGRDEHALGVVPVVPLVNRPRLRNRDGVSELVDVITLTDAAARALTNAQVATEVLATPQRWAAGMMLKDFVDADGNPLTAWETYFGAVWATENPEAKFGQFPAADLANFETMVDMYARHVAGSSGLPLRFFGQNTANPPAEGAIVADETRLIKTCEDKNLAESGSWELTQRIVMRLKTGDWDPELKNLETVWANPATPTRAQSADAMLKLTQGDNPVLPIEAAWEELGYSPVRRAQLRQMFREQRELGSLESLFPPLADAVEPPAP